MTKSELIEKTEILLEEEFDVDSLYFSEEKNIKETLELDSLGMLDMVTLVDREFGIKISNQDIAQLETFGDLYDYIYLSIKRNESISNYQ